MVPNTIVLKEENCFSFILVNQKPEIDNTDEDGLY
jgi:hypothetical protein